MGRLRRRLPALLALSIPVLAGLVFLHFAGAPQQYLLVNAGALAVGLALAAFLSAPASPKARRVLVAVLVAGLFVPLVSGPDISGVARWLPIGPFHLHSGSLLLPAILVLALRERDYAPPILLLCVFGGLLQPDAAIGFAIVFAAIGLHDVTRDWRIGLVCIFGFVAAIVMAVRGNPAPQDFVERVLVDAVEVSIPLALLLLLALVASFFLILRAAPASKPMRYMLAGSLFGFTILSIMNNYPSVLIGYGAAPILGYGFGLGLAAGHIDEAPQGNDEERAEG